MVGRTDDRARDERGREEVDDCAVRCLCGSLLARLVPGGVELKCRRCKQVRVIPLQASSDEAES